MRIEDIPRLPAGATAYVVGTGASLRCMPPGWAAGGFVIGVNQAWRHLRCDLSVTVHPELVLEYLGEAPARPTTWVVKKKPPLANLEPTDPHHYVFNTSYDVGTVARRPKGTLYLGEGAQTTAMDLAARLGAATIVLVGCDAKCLGGDYHAHDQHVRWVGRSPAEQYRLYREGTAAVRAALRPLGVAVLTLSPFIGVDAGDEDYARLRGELGLAPLPAPADVSPPGWKPPKR